MEQNWQPTREEDLQERIKLEWSSHCPKKGSLLQHNMAPFLMKLDQDSRNWSGRFWKRWKNCGPHCPQQPNEPAGQWWTPCVSCDGPSDPVHTLWYQQKTIAPSLVPQNAATTCLLSPIATVTWGHERREFWQIPNWHKGSPPPKRF